MKKHKIGIVGLGYVGLPLAVEFSSKYNVVGYDIDNKRITELNDSIDKTLEVDRQLLKNALGSSLELTSKTSKFFFRSLVFNKSFMYRNSELE